MSLSIDRDKSNIIDSLISLFCRDYSFNYLSGDKRIDIISRNYISTCVECIETCTNDFSNYHRYLYPY